MPTTYESLRLAASITPRLIESDTKTEGAAVDLGVAGGGFGRPDASIAVVTGTLTDGAYAVTVEDSAVAADGDTWHALGAEGNTGDGAYQGTPPSIAAANDNLTFEFGVRNTKRYIRVVITSTDTSDGGILGAVVAVGNRRFTPVR